MAINRLLASSVDIPKPDFSWLDSLASNLGDAVDKKQAQGLIKKSVNGTIQPQQAPQGFISRLMGGGQPAATPASAPTQTASVMPVERGQPQGSTYQPFIDTVKTKVTNPYGLAAVAATGRAESGWSPQNAARSWSDPSQSGQAGTAGGVMSWRAERLQNLQNYARSKGEEGNGSPATQAEFFLNEDPALVAKLNSARSPQEAQSLMNNAWKFAGYDQPGGETARRMALAQNYAANDFKDIPLEQGDTGAPQAGYVDPQVTTAFRDQPQTAAAPAAAPVQVADASGGFPAPAAPAEAPIRVDGDLLGKMLTNPYTRDVGLELWKTTVTGRKAGYDFMMAPNGDLLRTDKQGGVERVGNFAKAANGLGADEAGLNLVYGQDKDGNTIAFQPLKGGGLRQVELPAGAKLTPGISNIDTGTGTLSVNTKTGAPVMSTPKDVQGQNEQAATGKNNAEAVAALPQVESSASQIMSAIDSLASDPYLPSMLGPVNSRLKNLSADAERVQSKMDQIGGQTFLQAFNMLRGAGQITEVEGTKATAAMGRLNTAQNEKDYRDALNELREIVVGSLSRARAKAGRGQSETSAPTAAQPGQVRRYNPETGNIE